MESLRAPTFTSAAHHPRHEGEWRSRRKCARSAKLPWGSPTECSGKSCDHDQSNCSNTIVEQKTGKISTKEGGGVKIRRGSFEAADVDSPSVGLPPTFRLAPSAFAPKHARKLDAG